MEVAILFFLVIAMLIIGVPIAISLGLISDIKPFKLNAITLPHFF